MGITSNGGWFNDLTSTINPFDDENGAFQGSGGRVPVTPADPGADLSGQYWDQYGAGAQSNLQGQSDFYQGALTGTAANAANAGQAASSNLNTIGQNASSAANAAAADLNASGGQYAGLLQGAGATYGSQQAGLGQEAMGYGAQQAALAQNQGNAIGTAGANLGAIAAGAQGQNISGNQQAALMGLEANRGPSAAQGQLQQATNANQAAALAMARSGRGWGGSAGAMNAAANQRVGAQQTAANQSAVLSAQEDAAWRGRQASNIAQSGQLATSEAGTNNQREAALYGLGLQGMQAGANIGLQGSSLGMQGYGMNQAGLQAAANTHLGALGQAGQMDLGAQQAAGNMALAGYGQNAGAVAAGANAANAGYNTAGTNYANASSYGINNQNAQGAIVGQQYGLANQHQSNALQANAINNGLAIQQQNQGNQMMGASIGALGSVIPMIASAASDRNVKEDIEPANNVLAESSEPTIVIPKAGTAEPVPEEGMYFKTENGMLQGTVTKYNTDGSPYHQPVGDPVEPTYDPYSFGTGISGPNQIQADASNDAAQAASVAADAQRESASSKELKKVSGQEALNGGKGKFGQMLNPMGFAGNVISGAANNTAGDRTVNPITGRSWFEGNGGGGYQPYQSPGQIPMISDEREKEAMKAFDETPGFSYNYKDPEMSGATHGRQFGIMAQDLEKTPAGKSVVKEGPGGVKMVDTSRLALVEGAALNGALKRIAELEARLGSGKPKGKAA